MKTKIMTGVLAGVISSAAFAAPDVAAIKAACQSSDKTIWVEKNQICIPANPCTSDNMNAKQYCNTMFAGNQTGSDGEAKGVVDLYAKTHGLDCEPVNVQFSAAGQDYVTCVGNDVMVFEFDDTRDADHGFYHLVNDFHGSFEVVCKAAGGDIYQSHSYSAEKIMNNSYKCYGLTESVCSKVQEILFEKRGLGVLTHYDIDKAVCSMAVPG
jgi:hypothetical protein